MGDGSNLSTADRVRQHAHVIDGAHAAWIDGLGDDVIEAAVLDARQRIGGLRLSWTTVAFEALRKIHGLRGVE